MKSLFEYIINRISELKEAYCKFTVDAKKAGNYTMFSIYSEFADNMKYAIAELNEILNRCQMNGEVDIHMAEENIEIVKYIQDRIGKLYEEDKEYCRLRWDDPTASKEVKSASRKMSNQITFARQELQSMLKKMNMNKNN